MAQDGAAPSGNGAGVLPWDPLQPIPSEGAAAQGRTGQWGWGCQGLFVSMLGGSQRLYMRLPPLSLWEMDVNGEKVFERVTQMFV